MCRSVAEFSGVPLHHEGEFYLSIFKRNSALQQTSCQMLFVTIFLLSLVL